MSDVCKFAEALPAYLLGELAPREREEVDSHLAACQACKSRLDGFATVLGELKSYEPAAGAPNLAARVRSQIQSPARPSAGRGIPPLAAAAAGFVLIVLIAAVAFQSEGPSGSLSAPRTGIEEPTCQASFSDGRISWFTSTSTLSRPGGAKRRVTR